MDEILEIGNRDYIITDKIENFVYAINMNDTEDIIIKKIVGDKYTAVSEIEFNKALLLYTQKYIKISKD